MDTPGVTLRPIELLDGGFEVNEVFFEDVRVPAENLVGEENQGWTIAKFLLGNERVGIARIGSTKRMLAQAKEHAREITVDGRPLLEDPFMATRIAELENELLALELTALRVVANSADGRPHPASSVLKLKGSELQQAATELVVDIAGPLSLASFADGGSDVPDWARVATPHYLNYRKVSIYGGSNEVQRTIIAGTILGL
jgi:alkylation response protein AidB-like acyl-CoA dehydrogenase